MKNGYFYLVLIGMVNVALSLYYYALIVKAAYFLKPDEDLPRISLSPAIQLLTIDPDRYRCRRRSFPQCSL